jgi:hypothetical protein
MKIAILISGEYRTFGICRKTMPFLDDPRADIYVSTWNKTIYDVPKIGMHVAEDVTEDLIKAHLNKDAVIDIQPIGDFKEVRYSDKMIYHWKNGLELIKKSGIEYDYVMFLRPDLYFTGRNNFSFNYLEKYKDVLAAGWYFEPNRPFLNDIILLSSYETMCKVFNSLTIETWTTAANDDWHTWWFRYVSDIVNVENVTELSSCNFCRPWAKEYSTFDEISEIQQDWSDLRILALSDVAGKDIVNAKWPPGTMDRIEKKWNDGVYNKYMNSERTQKTKVALIISGMLRNYDTARLSLDIWGETDRFLVTWDSAPKEHVADYVKKADILETFIIPDKDFEHVYRAPCKNGMHTFHMVYLWEQAYKNVPKNYDKYIIIRPDGFYWTTDKERVLDCIKTEGPFKVSQERRPGYEGIDDHVIFMDASHFNQLENCYGKLFATAVDMITEGVAINQYNDYLNPHEMLYRMWKQNITEEQFGTDMDVCSSKLHSCIEALWVRDTFVEHKDDAYDEILYKAVFYDTASWWRRTKGLKQYDGIFNRLK